MAISANIDVIKEVTTDDSKLKKDWVLCLQWCKYNYDDGTHSFGYRFIWRRDDGNLQAARGQARIPSLAHVELLMAKAKIEGWENLSDKSPKIDNR
ncbi:hypothetical protein [Solibacillus daqui]|uniref:hypothetical protein n=1 Tax=Solibacillus daqui TaxID=2912187 RepID=UPI002365AD01|nr:hypothetical protein [Solibacillus daqui]